MQKQFVKIVFCTLIGIGVQCLGAEEEKPKIRAGSGASYSDTDASSISCLTPRTPDVSPHAQAALNSLIEAIHSFDADRVDDLIAKLQKTGFDFNTACYKGKTYPAYTGKNIFTVFEQYVDTKMKTGEKVEYDGPAWTIGRALQQAPSCPYFQAALEIRRRDLMSKILDVELNARIRSGKVSALENACVGTYSPFSGTIEWEHATSSELR